MVFVGRGFCRGVAFALLRHNVNKDRAFLGVADVFQNGEKVVEVVTINRADIIEPQLFKQSAAGCHAARKLFSPPCGFLNLLGEFFGNVFGNGPQGAVGAAGNQACKIGTHGTNRGGNGHIIVIEDDDEAAVHSARIVHRFIGHARTHGAVANDCNNVVIFFFQIPRHGHAQTCRNGGGRVARAKWIIFALFTLGEACEAVSLANGTNTVPATG